MSWKTLLMRLSCRHSMALASNPPLGLDPGARKEDGCLRPALLCMLSRLALRRYAAASRWHSPLLRRRRHLHPNQWQRCLYQ